VIRADAIGPGHPSRDLVVSPQHRILVSSVIALRMFDCNDVLIPANKLLSLDGIDVVDNTAEGVTYFHFLFDAHEIVMAEGLASESFLFGDYLCKETSALRAEIIALFPEFGGQGPNMSAARRTLRAHEARLLRDGATPRDTCAA
jgi:hypothetical protein